MEIILKHYRITLNMSKAELASKVNVSRTYISRIENNKCSPSPPVLKRIARALNICPYYLIDFCTNCKFDCDKRLLTLHDVKTS